METLNKIKVLLGMQEDPITPEEMKEAVEQLKFEDATLEDGTIVSAETMEAGQAVFIVVEEEKQPLPIGEYALLDGKLLVVEEEGVIAEIKEVEEKEEEEEKEEVEEVEEMQQSDDSKEALISAIGVLENLVQEFASIKEQVELLNNSLTESKDNESKLQSELSEFKSVSTEGVKPNPEGSFKRVTEVQNIDVNKMTNQQRVQYLINKKK